MRSMKLATALATIALVAAACSSAATQAPASVAPSVAPSAAPATVAPSVAPSEAASVAPSAATLSGSLTLWDAYSGGGTAETKGLEQILASIATQYPDLKLTVLDIPFSDLFTKFETEAAAGGGPDMFIGPNDNFGNEVRAGLLADNTSVAPLFAADTVQVANDGSQIDGKYYTIPESLKAVALFYNKDKVTTPPVTTDDLMNLVKSGVKVGINQGAYHNWGFWYAFGGQIMDATGKCVADQTAGVSDAMAYLKALKDAGATFYTDGAKMDDAFKTQKLDAIIDGPWFSGDAKAAYGDKLGVAPGPAQAAPFKPMTGVDGWYINASSPNVALAQQVAMLLTNQANQQIMVDVAGHIPANKNITISDPVTQGFANAVATGFARPQSAEMGNYWGNFGDALNLVMDKGADPVATVTSACAAMNKANKK